ncbi:MAG TPA: hypothetical protein VFB12_31550 [Ktedonobacteraceae bacterium]|nr:hypothetical protein [Ktedonobacteraceae bacterium]
MTYQQAAAVLYRVGFVKSEIDRLYYLRQTYQPSELDQPPLDSNHLQFARWLVMTGRLTEQLPEETKLASPDPRSHWSRLKVLLERLVPSSPSIAAMSAESGADGRRPA